MRTSKLITVALLLFHSMLQAYEVDQFTNRDDVKKESILVLDNEIQKRMQSAVDSANNAFIGKHSCRSDRHHELYEARTRLIEAMKSELHSSNPFQGKIEGFVKKSKEVDKRTIPFSESIYADTKFAGPIRAAGLSSVITLNGVQIGSDKLSHFFDEGFALYLFHGKSRKDPQDNLGSILQINKTSENSYYGLNVSGVKSYADAAANFEGYKFWEKVCGSPGDTEIKRSLPFEAVKVGNTYKFSKPFNICNDGSYIRCGDKGLWELNPEVKFSFKDYVNPAWDETINCNAYHPDMNDALFSALSRRVHTYKGDPKKPCPADPSKCANLHSIYSPRIRNGILSPICNAEARATAKGKKQDYTDTSHISTTPASSSTAMPAKTQTVKPIRKAR